MSQQILKNQRSYVFLRFPDFRWTPGESRLVGGGAMHDDIRLAVPGVSFTNPRSLVPSIMFAAMLAKLCHPGFG